MRMFTFRQSHREDSASGDVQAGGLGPRRWVSMDKCRRPGRGHLSTERSPVRQEPIYHLLGQPHPQHWCLTCPPLGSVPHVSPDLPPPLLEKCSSWSPFRLSFLKLYLPVECEGWPLEPSLLDAPPPPASLLESSTW